MTFNHYAKLARIIAAQQTGWYIVRIDQPTTATKFNGETVCYDHYYRLYTADGAPIKYGKFQQLERLAQVLHCDAMDLPIMSADHQQ